MIELAARKGVEDVKLIVANALHRRMTADEIKRMVGERVFRSFWPDDLANFDAEDRDELTEVGVTDQHEVVEISKRAAESDLIVYVNINLVAMDGGHKSVAGRARELPEPQAPPQRRDDDALAARTWTRARVTARSTTRATRMGRLLAASGVKIFQIETTVNNDTFPSNLGFLNKREWEWSAYDQALMMTAKKANDMAPPRVRREFYRRIEAPYKLTGINAGEVEAVHERTLENLHRQQLVEVEGQSDILVFGLPYVCPYNVNSILNPILVHCLGLGYLFNMYRNKPLVKPGGVVIMFHPVPWEFHQIHHPSYIDFFEEVLRETDGSRDARVEVRGALRERPVVHAPVPDEPRVPRRAPVLHVVLGRARARLRRRRDLRRRRPEVGGAPGLPHGVGTFRDALEMAKDTVGLQPVDHVHAHAAALDRGRAVRRRS